MFALACPACSGTGWCRPWKARLALAAVDLGGRLDDWLIKSRTRPELFTDTFEAAAFGAGPLEWTVPTYTLTSHLLSFLEPDPLVIWDDAQRARFRRRSLNSWPRSVNGPRTAWLVRAACQARTSP